MEYCLLGIETQETHVGIGNNLSMDYFRGEEREILTGIEAFNTNEIIRECRMLVRNGTLFQTQLVICEAFGIDFFAKITVY